MVMIFDFDGTLVDTTEGIVRTTVKALERLGYVTPPEEEIKGLIGLPIAQSLSIAAGVTDPLKVKECVDTYRDIYFESGMRDIRPYPGVVETLRRLKEEGHTLCIATSRSKPSLKSILSSIGVLELFDILIADEDVVNKKPAPDMVQKILSETGCDPQDTFMTGDTTFDIEMGHRAGVNTCAVTYGNHTEERLRTSVPHAIIHKFSDVLELVRPWV